MPRTLCVYLPKWSIQRVTIRRRGNLPERSVTLLVSTQRNRQWIAECCARAEGLGVRVGMTLAHARSLLKGHGAEIQNYSPEEDSQALKRLALWMLRFTPIVAVDAPDGLLLNIAGCEHLYGGERPLAQRIAYSLGRLGLDQRLAIGPTFSSVRMTARYAGRPIVILSEETLQDTISPFPIEALQIEPSVCEALCAVGVERIDQLLALPRDELAARFGSQLLRRIDQTLGAATELIHPVREPEPFALSYVFDGPVLNVAVIEATAKQLLHALTFKLKTACLGASHLTVELLRIDAIPQQTELSFSHPTNDPRHIWTLLCPELARVHLGFGVEVITLHATQTARVNAVQAFLWPECSTSAIKDQTLGVLLDRLIDRLGPSAVRHPVAVQTYIPEKSFHWAAFREAESERPTETTIYLADRPTRLFDVPESVEVIALLPDGPPAQLQWKGQTLGVRASLGPERITGRWWMRNHDGEQPTIETRDYFAVEDEHGRWLWLFRLASSGQWFVHGEWA